MSDNKLPERVLALLAKHGGWQATLDHIANLESRLAALAGAAPDGWELVGTLDGYGRITGDPKVRMIERRLEPGTLLYKVAPPPRTPTRPTAMADRILNRVPVDKLEEIRDLLTERRHGNPARSPAHNARLLVDALIAVAPTPRLVPDRPSDYVLMPKEATDAMMNRAVAAMHAAPVDFMGRQGHAAFRAAYAAAIAAAPPAEAWGDVDCFVREMRTSKGPEFFVVVKRDGRELTPHMYAERWKAEYDVAAWQHLLCGAPEPDLLAYGSDEAAAPAAPATEWTDSQIAEFMAVALRHTEYKRGTHGPTSDEIRQGLRRIGAGPRVTGGREDSAADLAELAYWRNSEAKVMGHRSQVDGLTHRERIAEIRRAALQAATGGEGES